MAPGAGLRLFIVHAPADAWFVEGFLLEALHLSEREVLVSSKLELGAVIVNEIERGALSPVTVVVVSPAFLASPWAKFANQLAAHQSIDAAIDGSATLVPALLADCELPLLSRFRVPLDFRNPDRAHWEAEAERLHKRLAATAPVEAQVPCPYPGMQPFKTEDAARFHGRTQEVKELLGRLRDGQRELYVIGHVTEEERQEQRRDVVAVGVGIHEQENLAVAQLAELHRVANAAMRLRHEPR